MKITTNFDNFELAGAGEKWENIPKEHQNNLINIAKNILQPARDILKEPIHISSGYRSQAHNKVVGGASLSQHCFGKALDIYVSSLTGLELFEFFIKNFGNKIGGIGLYSNEMLKSKFIHIDTRNKQNKNSIISWYYNSAGKYISPTPYMKTLAQKHGYTLLG